VNIYEGGVGIAGHAKKLPLARSAAIQIVPLFRIAGHAKKLPLCYLILLVVIPSSDMLNIEIKNG